MKPLLSFALLLLSSAANAARPEVEFTADKVAVRGLKPAGRVAWLAVIREPGNWHTTVRVLHGIDVATPGGALSIPASGAELSRAVWVMSEIDTGATVQTPTPGYAPSSRQIEIHAARGETVVSIVSPRARVLYVRPRVGAWTAQAYDGGAGDEDHQADARIVLSLSSLKAMRGNAHARLPDAFEPGDVLLVIDPLAMRTSRFEVAE